MQDKFGVNGNLLINGGLFAGGGVFALGGSPRPYALPAYFPWNPDFNIYGSGLGGYTTDYNYQSDKPTTTATYWVTKGGAGLMDGSSLANAYASIGDALTAAEANGDGEIIIDGGGIFRTGAGEAWTLCQIDNEDIAIVAQNGTPIIAAAIDVSGAWTLDTGTTYSKAITSASYNRVVDLNNLDADGDPQYMTLAADLATCRATANSYFDDGAGTTYVTLASGSAPDSDDLLFMTDEQFFDNTTKFNTFYLDGLKIYGTRGFWHYGSSVTRTARAIIANCEFGFSDKSEATDVNRRNVAINSVSFAAVINCRTYYTGYDGFNYYGYSDFSLPICTLLEVNANGHDANGDVTMTNSNITTAHNHIAVIRLNAVGKRSRGPMLGDVLGCHTLNLGCHMTDSEAAGTVNSNFTVGQYGGASNTRPAVMYLKDCEGSGSTYIARRDSGGLMFDLGGNVFDGGLVSGGANTRVYLTSETHDESTLETILLTAQDNGMSLYSPHLDAYLNFQSSGIDDFFDIGPGLNNTKRDIDAPLSVRAVTATDSELGIQVADMGNTTNDIYYYASAATTAQEVFFVVKYKDGVDATFDANNVLLSDATGGNVIRGASGSADLQSASAFNASGVSKDGAATSLTVLPCGWAIINAVAATPLNIRAFLGYPSATGQSWQGRVAMMMAFNTSLSTDQRADILAALQERFGL